MYDRRLSPGALITWPLLKSLAGSASATPSLSRADFCKLAGINRSTLYSHLQKLSDLGYLTRHQISRFELGISFPAELLDHELVEKNDIVASLKDSEFNNMPDDKWRLGGGDVQRIEHSTISRNPI